MIDLARVVPDLASPRTWWRQRGVRSYQRGDEVFLVRMTRGGFPIGASSFLVSHSRQPVLLLELEAHVEQLMKKPAERKVEGEQSVAKVDSAFKKDYPTLWEYLTVTKWEDGTARVPSSLLMFVGDGMFKLMLRDKNAGQCLWAAGDGPYKALAALDSSLSDPEAVWRQDRQEAGQQASRVRKASGGKAA